MPALMIYPSKNRIEDYKINKIVMEKNTTKDEALKENTVSVPELTKGNKQPDADDIVLYDECGDTLWDRVLRQEESKAKIIAIPNA